VRSGFRRTSGRSHLPEEDLDGFQQLPDLPGQGGRSFLCGAIAQFASNHDTGANRVFADGGDAAGDGSRRVLDEVRQDVGIEQVAMAAISKIDRFGRQIPISGKSSSKGLPSGQQRQQGTMLNRIDDQAVSFLRKMASLPGNSNSRGMRNAWFRPFLNRRTWRASDTGASFIRTIGICLGIGYQIAAS